MFLMSGKKLSNNHKGELVVKTPSLRTCKFWNDNDSKKMHDAYFNKYPNIWYHGDFIQSWLRIYYFWQTDATLDLAG